MRKTITRFNAYRLFDDNRKYHFRRLFNAYVIHLPREYTLRYLTKDIIIEMKNKLKLL